MSGHVGRVFLKYGGGLGWTHKGFRAQGFSAMDLRPQQQLKHEPRTEDLAAGACFKILGFLGYRVVLHGMMS